MRDSQEEILRFWFDETEPQLWFQENDAFDALLRTRYMGSCELARDCVCDAWSRSVDGSLALCLLLNQFPRHIYRGRAKAYAGDKKALLTAKNAVAKGFDQTLPPVKRRFLYLPYLHSESLPNQKISVELFSKMQKDDPLSYEHAQRNYRIIEKFGRFPHRNKVLGRENTPAEQEYLAGMAAGA
jgi:uncharacterized protein (DUF924 family)